MKEGPNIAAIAALIGDPARANMLSALMHGRALTATELGHEAGVSPSTASGHLAKLSAAGLVTLRKQGRHRYFRLSDSDIANVLEGLMGLASRTGYLRLRPGPKDPMRRQARVCYDHLAGDAGVRMFDHLRTKGFLSGRDEALHVTGPGKRFFAGLASTSSGSARGGDRFVALVSIGANESRIWAAASVRRSSTESFNCKGRGGRQNRGSSSSPTLAGKNSIWSWLGRRIAVRAFFRRVETGSPQKMQPLKDTWGEIPNPFEQNSL